MPAATLAPAVRRALFLAHVPEPLLAPPETRTWQVLWSTDDVRYGGDGLGPVEGEDGWRIPGDAAIALAPAS